MECVAVLAGFLDMDGQLRYTAIEAGLIGTDIAALYATTLPAHTVFIPFNPSGGMRFEPSYGRSVPTVQASPADFVKGALRNS